MLLRTRVTLMVSLALLALGATLVYVGTLRERLIDERFVQATTAGLETAWAATASSRLQRLEVAAEQLRHDVVLRRALSGGDQGTAFRRLRQLEQQGMLEGWLSRLEVLDPQGHLAHTSSDEIFPQSTVNRLLVEGMLRDAAELTGVGSDGEQGFVALVGRPLFWHDHVVGILTLVGAMDAAVLALARSLKADVLIVNRRGRVLAGTAPALWHELAESGGVRRVAPLQTALLGERAYRIATIRIDGYSGPDVARLVAIQDATGSAEAQRRLEIGGLAAVAALTLLVLAWLYGYLRRSFRPLESAIRSLRAIAAGDTSVSLDAERGRDEIGRIAGTVEALRHNAISLEQLRRSRARQRRRQELLIRRQMTALADTFDDNSRGAIMAELAEIEAMAGRQDPEGSREEMALVATTLEKLTGRVIQQHRALQELVAELREALAAKTSLVALQQELEIARTIQSSVLPPPPPPHSRFAVLGSMQPAEEIGGDFYDFFQPDENHLAIAIADVSGKGVPAAFFMAISRTLLRATAALERDPGSCIARVNDALAADNPELMFVTLFYGVLDLRTHRLTYVNAGHNPPVLQRKGREPCFVDGTGGISLAVMAGNPYCEGTLDLAPGDRLFLYTDGFTEAMDRDGRPFGEPRLLEEIDATAALPIAEQTAALVGAVKRFEAGARQSDDITCVNLEIRGPRPAPDIRADRR
ncbi:MAG TPA: SpoIIE family protein phosphatase [Geminicoccaceae bacterium]|nr:SpoIIE family protein phosphatase [Geminicoccaceae bacterium]